MKKIALAAALVAVLVTASACAGSPGGDSTTEPTNLATTSKERYDAAVSEGEVTWYAAWYNTDKTEAAAKLFEQTYPGIKVNVYRQSSGKVHQRLTQEIDARQSVADVVGLGELTLATELANAGHLAAYEPVGSDKILPDYRNVDPEGRLHTASVGHVLITYNPKMISEADAPKSWSDLLDERWKGRIAVSHPAANGYASAWATQMLLTKDDYLNRLAKQDVLVGQSIADTIPRVTSGERPIGISGEASSADEMLAGNPIAIIYPRDGATLIQGTVGILSSAPHPNAARLFLDFLFSKTYQDFLYENAMLPVTTEGRKPAYVPADFAEYKPTATELVTNLNTVIGDWRRDFGA